MLKHKKVLAELTTHKYIRSCPPRKGGFRQMLLFSELSLQALKGEGTIAVRVAKCQISYMGENLQTNFTGQQIWQYGNIYGNIAIFGQLYENLGVDNIRIFRQ